MKPQCRACKDTGVRGGGRYPVTHCECADTVAKRRTFAFRLACTTRLGRYRRRVGSPSLTAAEAATAIERLERYARFFGFRSWASMLAHRPPKGDGYGEIAVMTWREVTARLSGVAADEGGGDGGERRAA